MLNLAVILSSTRADRLSESVADWLLAQLQGGNAAKYEKVDLREHPMPFFDEPASNAWVPSKNPEAQRWQKKVAQYDGYIFVTAEYNRSVPAVLKNALDYAYPEWNRKPAAFFGYGSVGAARSIEQLRLICIELQMAPMRSGVHISGADFLGLAKRTHKVESLAYLPPLVKTMNDELLWWAAALQKARSAK